MEEKYRKMSELYGDGREPVKIYHMNKGLKEVYA